MSEAAVFRSGKTYRGENFPVASRLLDAKHRAPIMAFYEFVRTADDVADHPTLRPTEKLALLDELEATLFGRSDSQPEACALRDILDERHLDRRHARDILVAFRSDVTRRRCRRWSDLMDYCRHSAMPVGRFVLDVYGESHSTWPAADALCAALQIINHMQDCGEDYRRLQRVYLPLETLNAHGARIETLAADHADPPLRASLDDLCDRVSALLRESAGLSRQVRHARLGLEIAVIQRLAERLVRMLRARDPLAERVELSAVAAAGVSALGVIRGGTARLVGRRFMVRRARAKPAPQIVADHRPAAKAASGSSFYTAMRLLPSKRRQAVFEIYGFCRAVDDVADEGGDRAARLEELQAWRGRVRSLYGPDPAPECAGLAEAVKEFRLRRDDFLAVIDGMEMDVVADIRAPSLETLDLYCDRVASAVGRLCVRVFGMEEAAGRDLAHHLGRALQLTNILRDLDEDGGIGRLYLPREALDAAGIGSDDPATVLAHPALDAACRQVAAMAKTHFEKAEAVMAAAPRSAVRAPRIMGNAYRAILDGLLKRGWAPPRMPVRLNKAQAARIALRSLI